MKRRARQLKGFVIVGCLFGILVSAFMSGFFVGHREVFPYEELRKLRWTLFPETKVKTTKKVSNKLEMFEEFSPDVDFVFVGDSLIHSGRWNESFPAISVANRGVGGDKTADVKNRLNTILSTNPKYAFIMLGINDIYSYVAIDKVLENYAEIVEVLQKNHIKVVIQSTIQCSQVKCNERVGQVNKMNGLLRIYAEANGVKFLSLNELSSVDGLDSSLTSDGIHLSVKGYRVWVDILADEIENIGKIRF